MGAACIVLGLLLLAVLVVGGYTFFAACRRPKVRNWLDPEELKGTDREKLYPFISNAHNWFSCHKVEDIYVKSGDGLQLYARWIPAENPKDTDAERCISCMACVAICPIQAREVDPAILAGAKTKLEKALSGRKENEFFL